MCALKVSVKNRCPCNEQEKQLIRATYRGKYIGKTIFGCRIRRQRGRVYNDMLRCGEVHDLIRREVADIDRARVNYCVLRGREVYDLIRREVADGYGAGQRERTRYTERVNQQGSPTAVDKERCVCRCH